MEAHVTAEMNRLSAATAAVTTRALRRFYRWLASEEEIDGNPALRLKTPKVKTRDWAGAARLEVRSVTQLRDAKAAKAASQGHGLGTKVLG